MNAELLKRLRSVECWDATYAPASDPLVMQRAKGSTVWDVEGRPYLDLCAGFASLPFGHNPDFVLNFFREQADAKTPLISHGMGDVYPNESKIKLLEKLRSFLPSHLEKGALALSGGQAVEYALKTAIIGTGKEGIICFEGSYHGLDLGVLPTTAREDFRKPFANWTREENIRRVPFGCSENDLTTAKNSLKNVAAVLVEPIQGRAGIVMPPENWLKRLRDWCTRNDVLLIFDEIFVGFGRTGRDFFAREIACDIVCLGKALGSGFPISACFGTKKAMDAWPESKGEAIHTGTFFGHPFSCEIAYRNLEEMEQTNLFQMVEERGSYLRERLLKIFSDRKESVQIRGSGLMIGIEFQKNGYAAFLMDQLRKKQIIALPSGATGNILSLTPALNISKQDLDAFLERI